MKDAADIQVSFASATLRAYHRLAEAFPAAGSRCSTRRPVPTCRRKRRREICGDGGERAGLRFPNAERCVPHASGGRRSASKNPADRQMVVLRQQHLPGSCYYSRPFPKRKAGEFRHDSIASTTPPSTLRRALDRSGHLRATALACCTSGRSLLVSVQHQKVQRR